MSSVLGSFCLAGLIALYTTDHNRYPLYAVARSGSAVYLFTVQNVWIESN